jgi:hypothetical protein
LISNYEFISRVLDLSFNILLKIENLEPFEQLERLYLLSNKIKKVFTLKLEFNERLKIFQNFKTSNSLIWDLTKSQKSRILRIFPKLLTCALPRIKLKRLRI